MSEWVSVKDRLPEYGAMVLIYDCDYDVWAGRLSDCDEDGTPCDVWSSWDGTTLKEVTHWMPLPEPPKEEK